MRYANITLLLRLKIGVMEIEIESSIYKIYPLEQKVTWLKLCLSLSRMAEIKME